MAEWSRVAPPQSGVTPCLAADIKPHLVVEEIVCGPATLVEEVGHAHDAEAASQHALPPVRDQQEHARPQHQHQLQHLAGIEQAAGVHEAPRFELDAQLPEVSHDGGELRCACAV